VDLDRRDLHEGSSGAAALFLVSSFISLGVPKRLTKLPARTES
jgi:hypothetical protein